VSDQHALFSGTVPANYDRYLGPLFFQPHALAVKRSLPPLTNGSVLELACGTGILTRVLRNAFPAGVNVVATDLNQAMIDCAREAFAGDDSVAWSVADATSLPYPSNKFDAIVCQFGFMFFPDKPASFRECARVLAAGGTLVFNVWEALERNEIFHFAHEAAQRYFPDDPPTFYNTPFGFHDRSVISALLDEAGFERVSFVDAEAIGTSPSPESAAKGVIEGSPIVIEIRARDPAAVAPIRDDVATRVAARFGPGPVTTVTYATICSAHKPYGVSTS
jgi:ubiquinone/menaquinone biosynthesis C-methylase UbiE